MTSEYLEIVAWHKHAIGTVPPYNNSTFRKHTTGWQVEKKEWLAKKTERTIEKLLEKESENNADALIKILKSIKRRVESEAKLDLKDEKSLKILWEILRVENKLPTKISNALLGEDPGNKFTSLADAFKALDKHKKQTDEPKA